DGLRLRGALRRARPRPRHRPLRARADRRVHGARRARAEAEHGDRHARPLRRDRPGRGRRARRLPPGLPARPHARGGDRLGLRAARRVAGAPRGEGPRGAVRDRGDGPRARARVGRGRRRDLAAPRVGASGARLRPHARHLGRGVHARGAVRRGARRGRRRPAGGGAVPRPLLRHRVCEPERDKAPPVRRGDAAGGAARGGARALRAARDRDQRVARRGVVAGDPRGTRGVGRRIERDGRQAPPPRHAAGARAARIRAAGDRLLPAGRRGHGGVRRPDRDHRGLPAPVRAARRRVRARVRGRRGAAAVRGSLLRLDAGGGAGRRLQRARRRRRRGVAQAGPAGLRPVTLQPGVFKAYDVRGLYPSEVDEKGAYAIGRAYVEQFEPRRVAVGRDVRLSSPAMAAAAVEGAADAGADVVDIGMVGTEMLYFAVGELGLDGGIAVTASHNPKEYTGMKIVRRGALPVGGESGLHAVRDRALGEPAGGARRGEVRREDVYPRFVERALSFVDVSAIRPLRVVIDAANGMAGAMLPPVLERLPIDAVRCYFEPDGSFPNHEPNPLLPENREFIVGKTLEERADLGVAFDGDAGRCFFVDDAGEFVPGDFVTALLAVAVLEKEPGAKIIYDVRASWAVPNEVSAAGGVPLINRVGHAYIKHRMRKEDAAFAGEVSGHYYFRDFSQADTVVVPFLVMLELIAKRGKRLSEILQPFRSRYFITGELNTRVSDVALKLQEL